MQGDEARILLGFPPNSRPNTSQVKEAYKRKVWESHPDLFPAHEKLQAESRFKLRVVVWSRHVGLCGNCEMSLTPRYLSLMQISEAYGCLLSGAGGEGFASAGYAHVVRTGVPRTNGGRSNYKLIGIPFLFIILGTVGLGGLNASRAYRKQKDAYPSHNPFLP